MSCYLASGHSLTCDSLVNTNFVVLCTSHVRITSIFSHGCTHMVSWPSRGPLHTRARYHQGHCTHLTRVYTCQIIFSPPRQMNQAPTILSFALGATCGMCEAEKGVSSPIRGRSWKPISSHHQYWSQIFAHETCTHHVTNLAKKIYPPPKRALWWSTHIASSARINVWAMKSISELPYLWKP